EQEGIFCLGYKVHDNKFLGVQVRERQGCIRCVPTEKAFLSSSIVWVRDKGAQRDREAKVFQEKEYQTGWKINMGNALDYWNQRSTQQCTKSRVAKHLGVAWIEHQNGVAKHLGVAWIEHQNGLVDETNVTLFAKVLHGFEFEVEPLGDHTFEVEPQENIDQGAGLQEVQTQHLMDYQLARDREQHLACELFRYREDSNEVAFAIAAVEKIYAHESLTFNNTVACDVISKWKARLKDDMDARSDVYVLSNDCRSCNDDSDATKGLLDKAKGNVLGMEIVRDQSGYTLRILQSMFYNEKLVHTLLEGHSILSLEGSLSGDCDVEKNDKWSCIYAVGSQEYQMVCTILDIASANIGMLDKFDRGLQTDVKVFVDFDYAMGRSIIVIDSIYELRLVVAIATAALVKGDSRFEVPAQVKQPNEPQNEESEEKERGREGNPKNSNAITHNEEQKDTPQLELRDETVVDNLGPNLNDDGIEWLDVEEPLDLVNISEESVNESLIKEMPKCSLNYDFRIKKGDPRNLKIPCMIGHRFTANAYIDVDLPMNIMSLAYYNSIRKNGYEYMGRNFAGFGRDMHVFVGNMSYVMDFTILESIETNIDPILSNVVFGRPFIEIACLAIYRKYGLINFIDWIKEITFKTPYKDTEMSESSGEGHDLLSFRVILSEDDYDSECKKPSNLEDGFYKDTSKLGPEYLTIMDDEGEVT
nr:zinc finger, CCHC-type [Tanacetum cinerariifolium]